MFFLSTNQLSFIDTFFLFKRIYRIKQMNIQLTEKLFYLLINIKQQKYQYSDFFVLNNF